MVYGCCRPRSAKRDSKVMEERLDGGRGSAHLAEVTLAPRKMFGRWLQRGRLQDDLLVVVEMLI
uniref:Uncharacterized protein n=1 Tax=Nymphaea colorata TaxID=210225 RepID=A0A5K0ZBX4_9MAGN